MRKPTTRVRDVILRALDFLQDAEPSDNPSEERRENNAMAAADAWIRGHAPPLESLEKLFP